MTYRTPCNSPENEPDWWFINREGKQYTEDFEDLEPEARDDAIKDGLARRQHAKHLCFAKCIKRNDCLSQALEEGHAHGTWGGYFEEEMREIRKEIAKRKNKTA